MALYFYCTIFSNNRWHFERQVFSFRFFFFFFFQVFNMPLCLACVRHGWLTADPNKVLFSSGVRDRWKTGYPRVRWKQKRCFSILQCKRKECFSEVRKSFQHGSCERMRRWTQAQQWMVTGVCEHRDWAGWLVWGHDPALSSYCALDLFHRLTWVFLDLEQPLGRTGDRSAVKWENLVKVETKTWLQHSRRCLTIYSKSQWWEASNGRLQVLSHLFCKASQHLLYGLAPIFKQTLMLPFKRLFFIWWLYL